jgi:hypothetical protein
MPPMPLKLAIIALLLAGGGCMPSSGPSPNAVYVIPANFYSVERVLAPLDALALNQRIDKKADFGDIYEFSYWYPRKNSEIYGVALVKWRQDLEGSGIQEMKGRYFVEVYTEDKACAFCKSVKASLAKYKVSFFSACEHPSASTAFEKIRCGI